MWPNKVSSERRERDCSRYQLGSLFLHLISNIYVIIQRNNVRLPPIFTITFNFILVLVTILTIQTLIFVLISLNFSYLDGIAETVTSNMTVLMAGFSLIIFYFSFAMGRFNWIEQRVNYLFKWLERIRYNHRYLFFFLGWQLVLSIMGVSVVGQAILASYGLCFYLGVLYGPVHPIIPFLMLGIGVDDMFVIIQVQFFFITTTTICV